MSERERGRERGGRVSERESLLGTTLISSSSNDTSYERRVWEERAVLLTIKKCLKVSNYIALSTERERREREKGARE